MLTELCNARKKISRILGVTTINGRNSERTFNFACIFADKWSVQSGHKKLTNVKLA